MSVQIVSNFEGIVTAKITGKLYAPELAALQNCVTDIIDDHRGVIRILIILENFQGFGKDGDWDNIALMTASDAYINKMAIVGEKNWKETALTFTAQGLREFPIEYFPPDEVWRKHG
ncbi:STAS/SEC14 domain-containing protein [Methylomonas sp. MgM2]